jgi:DAACS family dicarboxylate/amino acid:cation (Na+ or H+) symporter
MRPGFHLRIALGAAIGIAAGVACHFAAADAAWLAWLTKYVTQPVGQVFMRLLLMLVIPLVFSALALGVAGLGDLRSLGRVGLKTLAYAVCVSVIAVAIGVTLVQTFRPGDGLDPKLKAELLASTAERAASVTAAPAPKSGIDLIVGIVPKNPIAAAASDDMLAVMFFAAMLGVGLLLVRSEPARRLEEALQGLFDVGLRLIHVVIGCAPIGVAALLFTLTAQLGYEILVQLGRYVLVVLGALALHQFVVYSLSVKLLGRLSPRTFFAKIQPAMITAFSTSSSNATLPTAIQVAEEDLKLPRHVARFVLTVGSTANQNGTALFEGVTVLFLAQFYGMELTLQQQMLTMGICVLGGIGTAGVPSGSIPVIAAVLAMLGIPLEGLGLVLGVDRLLDMSRTVVNVSGDLAAAVIVARGERAKSGTAKSGTGFRAVAPPAGLDAELRDALELVVGEPVLLAHQREPRPARRRELDALDRVREVPVERHELAGARRDPRELAPAARQHQPPAAHARWDGHVEHAHAVGRPDLLHVAAQAAVDVRIDARAGAHRQRVQVEGVARRIEGQLEVAREVREGALGRAAPRRREHHREAARPDEIAVQVVGRELRRGQDAPLEQPELARREGGAGGDNRGVGRQGRRGPRCGPQWVLAHSARVAARPCGAPPSRAQLWTYTSRPAASPVGQPRTSERSPAASAAKGRSTSRLGTSTPPNSGRSRRDTPIACAPIASGWRPRSRSSVDPDDASPPQASSVGAPEAPSSSAPRSNQPALVRRSRTKRS